MLRQENDICINFGRERKALPFSLVRQVRVIFVPLHLASNMLVVRRMLEMALHTVIEMVLVLLFVGALLLRLLHHRVLGLIVLRAGDGLSPWCNGAKTIGVGCVLSLGCKLNWALRSRGVTGTGAQPPLARSGPVWPRVLPVARSGVEIDVILNNSEPKEVYQRLYLFAPALNNTPTGGVYCRFFNFEMNSPDVPLCFGIKSDAVAQLHADAIEAPSSGNPSGISSNWSPSVWERCQNSSCMTRIAAFFFFFFFFLCARRLCPRATAQRPRFCPRQNYKSNKP